MWNDCGSMCTKTCAEPTPRCTKQCVPKCECPAAAPVWAKGECIEAATCDAAWVGGVMCSVPRFLDRKDDEDETIKGFANELAPLLGEGSFDAGAAHPFRSFIKNCPLGKMFDAVWNGLRDRVSDENGNIDRNVVDLEKGHVLILDETAENAGYVETIVGRKLSIKPQHDIMQHIELVEASKLDVKIDALDRHDQLRISWHRVGITSKAWISALPIGGNYCRSIVYRSMWSIFLGTPDPMAAPLVASKATFSYNKNKEKVTKLLDPYCANLTSATMQGDHWRKLHDSVK